METDRTIYLAMAELVRRRRDQSRPADRGPLTPYELRCFSQHGEDGVIAEILARIGTEAGFFVEFGVETGREGNCVFLADVLAWRGVFMEPDPDAFASLSRKYAANSRVATLNAAVTEENLESLLKGAGAPSEPDVLSIDVDGQDYWLWASLQTYRPRVVVIEYNALLPAGRRLAQPRGERRPWDGTDYFGASLDALASLAAEKGYKLVHTDLAAINAFFVRGDLAAERFPETGQVPRRHEPNYFMQGYHHPADPQRRPYTDVGALRPGGALSVPPPGSRLDSAPIPPPPTRNAAQQLAARTDFVWHQRFELAPDVFTPGTNNVEFLLEAAGVPADLSGATVLDIGTTNGGAAFACERRGASRVLAVDIADENWFGFAAIKECLGSRAEHLQASIYELPELLGEQFDIVLFWGVLYHLRHPLLALDNVRRLTRQQASIETAVCDHELAHHRDLALARFYRRDELGADPSNWFTPTVTALGDWCRSCGLDPSRIEAWPERAPARAMVQAAPTPGDPEYMGISYERPLRCTVAQFGV